MISGAIDISFLCAIDMSMALSKTGTKPLLKLKMDQFTDTYAANGQIFLSDNIIPSKTRVRFTNVFLPAIQIRWKLGLAIIPLLAIRSQQMFAHATTAQLSCHVQNLVAITVLESSWEWNEISIEFELQWKKR